MSEIRHSLFSILCQVGIRWICANKTNNLYLYCAEWHWAHCDVRVAFSAGLQNGWIKHTGCSSVQRDMQHFVMWLCTGYGHRKKKGSPSGSLTHAGVCLCVLMVVPVQRMHVCFISQCQSKSVVCPSTRTGTVKVLVGSYDSALQHWGRKEQERAREGERRAAAWVCTGLDLLSWLPPDDCFWPTDATHAVRGPIYLAYNVTNTRLEAMSGIREVIT